MGIKQRIAVMIGIPVLALLLLVGLGWWSLRQLTGPMNHVVNNEFASLIDQEITPMINEDMLPVINEDLQLLQGLQESIRLILEADRDAHQALIAERMALMGSSDEIEVADATNLENAEQVEMRTGKAAAYFNTDDTKSLYTDFIRAYDDWKKATRNVIAWSQKSDKLDAARQSSYTGESQQAFSAMRDLLDKLGETQDSHIQTLLTRLAEKRDNINEKEQAVGTHRKDVVATVEAASRQASFMIMLFLVVGVVTAVVAMGVAFVFTRLIVGALDQIITGLTEGSQYVSFAAGQVSSASQSLAEGATEQAAGLQETSSSLEEMASMTKQNADNARQANVLSSEARQSADMGSEAMGRMNDAILDIQKDSDETANIIKVIDDIAFQTNLLALNAAVEAARAGEAGKGFAVVAEEVRNLAMRSAEAARNTSDMIEESVKNAKNGVDIAGEVTKVLGTIVSSVGKTTDLVSEIAAASQEQAQGIDQVNTAVAQMDKVTQQNAANAEESVSASEELTSQAHTLNGIVGQLVALAGGVSKRVASGSSPSQMKSSDRIFHCISDGSQRKVSVSAMEKAIPLDNDADFDGFNM